MESRIFIEENNHYQMDCSKAEDMIILHDAYKEIGILSDVDIIIINRNEAIFVEYKNNDIADAVNPSAFVDKIKHDNHYIKIARKYYDSLIYFAHKKDCSVTKRSYYYVLECKQADSVIRKMIASKVKKKLPFYLHKSFSDISHNLIDDFAVVNIKEWNDMFPEFKFEEIL